MRLSNKGSALVWLGLAVTHLLFTAAAQAQGVSFINRLDFPAGSVPSCVAVGDFNGDGRLDLAVADVGVGSYLSVLLGNGDGSFQAPRNFPAGGYEPSSVAVGDFNGDGRLDLAIANISSNDVSVMLGNGDGSFQAARNFPAGNYASSVAVGDFNGDGRPDLAVAISLFPGGVAVLLGNGDGSFQAPRTFDAGNPHGFVAVADFNGDGLLDLAVSSLGTYPEYRDGSVSILLGTGDGSFQAPRPFPVGRASGSVAVGDSGRGQRRLRSRLPRRLHFHLARHRGWELPGAAKLWRRGR